MDHLVGINRRDGDIWFKESARPKVIVVTVYVKVDTGVCGNAVTARMNIGKSQCVAFCLQSQSAQGIAGGVPQDTGDQGRGAFQGQVGLDGGEILGVDFQFALQETAHGSFMEAGLDIPVPRGTGDVDGVVAIDIGKGHGEVAALSFILDLQLQAGYRLARIISYAALDGTLGGQQGDVVYGIGTTSHGDDARAIMFRLVTDKGFTQGNGAHAVIARGSLQGVVATGIGMGQAQGAFHAFDIDQ